ncbi:MAG: hypothetical protein IAG10_22270 [Planctomycetaceae bacterium]|nr:hypothetical protein [Planctomycetaceae bacterium]
MSYALRVEHQPKKILFDHADIPGIVRSLEVFQVVIAVEVDQVKREVLAAESTMPQDSAARP